MGSKARDSFQENKKDIQELWSIHQQVGGPGAGRKYGVDVLNRQDFRKTQAPHPGHCCWLASQLPRLYPETPALLDGVQIGVFVRSRAPDNAAFAFVL
jgi:hypothetical protein